MGPEREQENEFKPQRMAALKKTVSKAAVKVAEKYFHEPLHYLLYGSLAGVTIGLLFGVHFPWELYVLVGIFAGIKLIDRTT